MKYIYFISFYAEYNGELPTDDIVKIDYKINDSNTLNRFKSELVYDWFGDNRKITIITLSLLEVESM